MGRQDDGRSEAQVPNGPRGVIRAALFPVLMAATVVGVGLAVTQGANLEAVAFLAPFTAGLCLIGLERWLPYERSWTRGRGDLLTDFGHLIVSGGLIPVLYQSTLAVALQMLGAWVSGRAGVTLWPTEQPLALQVVLAIVVGELGYYWAHRAGHALFWRIHATHHSSERLYWLNVVRFHPLDALLQTFGWLGPLALLGAPPETLAIVIAVTSVHGLLQHSNVDLRLGPLNHVFAGAELHRWHHVPDARGEHNYGQLLSVYDRLFGTWYLPPEEPPREVGVAGGFPRSYWGQLLSPLRSRTRGDD